MKKTVLMIVALAAGVVAMVAHGMVSGRHARPEKSVSRVPQAAADTSGFTALASETKTLELGDVKVTWIQDRAATQSASLFPQAPASLIDSLGLRGGIPSSMSVFLVESKGMRILFDTGLGAKDSRLLPLLSLMGLTPADIGFIYLTHLHGDHIGGLMQGGRAVFPTAQVFVAKQEFRGWMRMPAEKKAQVEKMAKAYRLNLHFFDFGDYLPGDVKTIDASGHAHCGRHHPRSGFAAGRFGPLSDLRHGARRSPGGTQAHLAVCPHEQPCRGRDAPARAGFHEVLTASVGETFIRPDSRHISTRQT